MGPHDSCSGEIAGKNKQEISMRQLVKSIGALAAVAVLAVGISQVSAHHSAAMFDFSKSETIKGTVMELRWVNPHVTVTINGSHSEEEAPAEWLMEMTSPGNLVRAGGWRRDAVKPGDKVEVMFSPLRDPGDKKSGLLKQLTVLATGEVFTANIRDQEKPGLE
jgi:Family of unknown function (DUF6152)